MSHLPVSPLDNLLIRVSDMNMRTQINRILTHTAHGAHITFIRAMNLCRQSHTFLLLLIPSFLIGLIYTFLLYLSNII